MQSKRILWLYNHSTLMKSEVKMLRELGYEVYIPKVIPFDVSVAVDWEADKLLSIPREAIERLNEVDFYDQKIPDDAMKIMNEYFHIAIFGVFIEPLKSIVLNYEGIMLFHPFSVEDGLSYTKIIELHTGIWFLKEIEKIGNRFWFGQSYENLMEIECDFFQKRAINLPIGMVNTEIDDKWHGSTKKALFICPGIKISSYYEGAYKQFTKDFKGIPYSIGGAQPIPVEGDKKILGYLPQTEYEDLYSSHSVMYYHSTHRRHVDYHPFEAIKCGLPLVFMAGGLLDKLGGANLPGRCKTLKEARAKCKKIINGNRRLAEKIRASQGVLLDKMSYQYCKDKWEKALKIIESTSQKTKIKQYRKRKKIAVIMPQIYLGGVLDYTLRLLKAFTKGMQLCDDSIELIFGVPEEMDKKNHEDIQKVEEYGVAIRPFSWEEADKRRIKELTSLIGFPASIYKEKYNLMNDGICYFEDCDFFLFMADIVPLNLFLIKPYGVIIHDYKNRYLPEPFVPEEILRKYEVARMSFVRNSECNFTTSRNAADDGIQYAGLKKKNIHLLPLFFEDISEEVSKENNKKVKKMYFVWSTNISIHKNHKVVIKALSDYYQVGGKLHCYVTGVNTDLFGNKASTKGRISDKKHLEYIEEIKKMINNDSNLKKYIHFKGQLPKLNYYNVVLNAQFMLHPGMADNGNGAVVDAAFLGTPSISSDYPAMRNIDSNLDLGLVFFDKQDSKQLKDTLLWAEKNVSQMKQQLPSIDALRRHTVEDMDLCKNIYQVITRHANI